MITVSAKEEVLEKRATAARALLKRYSLDAVLFSRPPTVRYLSSLNATSAAVLVTRRSSFLYTDFRYLEEAMATACGFNVKGVKDPLPQSLADEVKGMMIRRLGFESSAISYASHRFLKKGLGRSITLVPLEAEIDSMREVKDPGELGLLVRAAGIAESALYYFREVVREGMTEREVASLLDTYMRAMGSERSSFEIIVASGRRTSMPHAKASERRIKAGEPIVVDLGAVIGGYHSDLTRTFFLDKIPPRCRALYERVLEAQSAAIAALKDGTLASEVDGIARKIIDREPKVGDFGHSLGHGVGLEIHEAPVLSPSSKKVLRSGMVLTIEPGIYRKGSAGVRIEDMVLVKRKGPRLLTHWPKKIEDVVIE